ncbi:MAG: hypothetical protein ACOX8N_10695 [Christensenellales bacterium]
MKRLSAIFSEPPKSLGLRAETQLWEEFRARFAQETAPPSEEIFIKKLYDAFEELTGRPVRYDSLIYVPRLSRGGMGSGLVDPWTWRAVVFPALARRYREINSTI